ncbi:MAG TPA: ABC transporter permease [Acidimicrobiales bacterium]|nr:ABC transporter permease [Acidimicrobiales bacterium]
MEALRPLDDAADRVVGVGADDQPGYEILPSPTGAGPERRSAWYRRRKGKRGVAFWLAVAWLVLVAFCAVAADWLPLPDPNRPDVLDRLEGFSPDHPLGADPLGRDQLSRLVHGARVSIVVAVSAVGIGLVVGGTLGTAVGYLRGRTERVVMAVVDVIAAFPALVLLLAVLAFIGRSLTVISLLIGALSVPIYTRVARANTLSIAQRDFVHAAHTLGAKRSRILFREILPNVVPPVAAFALVAMGLVIVIEGSLALLGLSVPPPEPTWGGMIANGKPHLEEAVHVALVPSAAMFLTVLSLNFVGDTLRRSLDVRDANL